MIKRYRKNKLNGSVLYTVVAVMMIMTVFIFAALSLASAANRRAFNSYANNQTQYTARSVVETVWDQIENNPELAKQIANLTGSKNIDVTLPDKSMGEVTNATVTYLGKGTDYGYDIDDPFYKLSVTVKMLGQENTLAGYFLPEKIENPSFDYALVSLDSVGSNNFDIYGPLSFGANKALDTESMMSNDGKISSPVQFNGDLSIRYANNVNVSSKSGLYINGNFNFNNGGTLKPVITSKLLYRELPYLYVAKKINYNSTDTILGSYESPMLIMADSMGQASSNDQSVYGDVYLYGTESSDIGTNRIKQWKSDIIYKQDNSKPVGFKSYTGGNIYSLSEIKFTGTGGTLANNIVANNFDIISYQPATFNATGSVVSKSVNITPYSGLTECTFDNGIFVDPAQFNWKQYTKINGIELASPYIYYENVYEYNRTAENTALNGTYLPLMYEYQKSTYGGTYLSIPYDFSDIFPADVDESLISISPKSITINTSSGIYPLNTNIVNVKYKFSPDSWNVSNKEISINSQQTIQIDDRSYNSRTGTVDLFIEPVDGYDAPMNTVYGPMFKTIVINSISVDFNVSLKKINVDNTKFLRAVNDVSFTNNGNIIYIDDIDKSVKIERIIDEYGTPISMKISKADLTGVEEGNELDSSLLYTAVDEYNYDKQYADFLCAVVNTVTFPESMKKDKVLKSKGGFVDNSILNTKNGVSELQSHAEEESAKAFEHIDETENLVYDFDSNKIFNKENVELGDITFPLNVISSCTFKGNLGQNDFINITPSSEKVYIKLDNFSMENGCQKKDMIIVDDDNGTKSAVFLIPKGQDITIVGNVLTNYYKNNSEIIKDPIKYDTITGKNVVDSEKIPGIYFYMENDTTRMSKLRFEYSHTSAYIVLPTGKLEADNGGYTKNYKYNGEDIGSKDNAIIGAVICKEVSVAANNRFFAYVNPNPKLPEDTEEELHYKARCIYYQSY